MNTLIAFTRLRAEAPGADAPDAVVAGWYDRKAALHTRLAAEAGERGHRLEQARESRYAALAAAHAERLRDLFDSAVAA